MELRDPKALAQFIKNMGAEHAAVIHLREDGTIDIMFGENTDLRHALTLISCPYCKIPVFGNDRKLEDTVRGMYIRCPSCRQRFFAHIYVPFGGSYK